MRTGLACTWLEDPACSLCLPPLSAYLKEGDVVGAILLQGRQHTIPFSELDTIEYLQSTLLSILLEISEGIADPGASFSFHRAA